MDAQLLATRIHKSIHAYTEISECGSENVENSKVWSMPFGLALSRDTSFLPLSKRFGLTLSKKFHVYSECLEAKYVICVGFTCASVSLIRRPTKS